MRAYWWNDVPNMGDALTPYLLAYFSNLDITWSPLPEAEIVVTGSVLHHISADWAGRVLGTGLVSSRFGVRLRDASVLALRGPLTAARVKGEYALGDPGLLADEMVPLEEKRYDLGVVPHWS